MTEFRLTQVSDTHLSRAGRFAGLTDNFHRVSEHIDAARPDLVVNSGDVSWDGPTSRSDLEYAKGLHAALPVNCRYLPGNHDIGDNPTAVGEAPSHQANEKDRAAFVDVFGEDRFQFEAAGWYFVGLNSLIMNTAIPSEAEQMDWFAGKLSDANGKPIALFLHKPLFLQTPEDPETPATAIRFVILRQKANRARGVPLPPRQFRNAIRPRARSDRYRSGRAAFGGQSLSGVTPCPARRARAACRNWRPSTGP